MSDQRVAAKSITFFLDGKQVEAKPGESIIQVADRHGVYIPRFCYHEKLSVVANCRMCLVEVKGAPKTLPACATPVAEGMEVFSASKPTLKSQRSVMEFLLINHPLDCPICDQGGECELQDLAMGFGRGVSRFYEGKRSVDDEDLGPLVDTHMTRCIHCTRCVRFGSEETGQKVIGELYRGGEMRIGTYLKRGVHDELSANIIDLCPVGALTSKPFQYKGRSWNFIQNPGIGLHDGVGSRVYYQTFSKGYANATSVMRTLPRPHASSASVPWISDRDRFSYEGLESKDRLTTPMLKKDGKWREVSWQEALSVVAEKTHRVLRTSPSEVAALVSPNVCMQDGYALAELMRSFGCQNIDHRLHMGKMKAGVGLGAVSEIPEGIECLGQVDAALLLGCHIRHEAPMAGYWLRKAALKGAKVFSVNPARYQVQFPYAGECLAIGEESVQWMLGVFKVLKEQEGIEENRLEMLGAKTRQYIDQAEIKPEMKAFVQAWLSAKAPVLMLGAYAQSLDCWQALAYLASQWVSLMQKGRVLHVQPGCNALGLHQVGAVPHLDASGPCQHPGDAAYALWEQPRKVYWLQQFEVEHDVNDAALAMQALKQAELVVMFTSFVTPTMQKMADVLLPVGMPTETGGRFTGLSGQAFDFESCVPLPGMAAKGWEVVLQLASRMGITLSNRSEEDWTRFFQSFTPRFDGAPIFAPLSKKNKKYSKKSLWRLGDRWLYGTDPLVRRAKSLQKMAPLLGAECLRVHPETLKRLGLMQGQTGVLRMGDVSAKGQIAVDASLHPQVVGFAAGFDHSQGLGAYSGEVVLEKGEGQ